MGALPGREIRRSDSPNGEYSVILFETWSNRRLFPVGSGQGSDSRTGYVRLFKRGEKAPLKDAWQKRPRIDLLIHWDDNGVFVDLGNGIIKWPQPADTLTSDDLKANLNHPDF
jgi:hypothetical protein